MPLGETLATFATWLVPTPFARGRWRLALAVGLFVLGTAPGIVTSDSGAQGRQGLVFAAVGDYGNGGERAHAVARSIHQWEPDFVLTLGDNNYEDGCPEAMDRTIGALYARYIGNYHPPEFALRFPGAIANDFPGAGDGPRENRFFPTLGNHDTECGALGAEPYTRYFTLPGLGFTSSSGNERYYDFVQGNVHFFALNSAADEPDGVDRDSRQARWLKAQLARSTSEFDVVYLHVAPFSSERLHRSSPVHQWPYAAWGADVVIAGHAHVYERLIVDGIPYFVVGTGGKTLRGFGPPERGSAFRYRGAYGALRVSVTPGRMAFEFLTTGGRVVDAYAIRVRRD